MSVFRLALAASAGLIALAATSAHATTYYVDPTAGNDSNSGTTTTAPWQTLGKVNGTTFSAGDQILFATGGVWTGQLSLKGSGTPGNPITLGKYGATAPPVFKGNGVLNGTVLLLNRHDWVIQDIEVTNHTSTPKDGLIGILALNQTNATLSHLTIKNTIVHDVTGVANAYYGENAGIAVVDLGNTLNGSTNQLSCWSDVTISGNNIYDVDRIGIFVGPATQRTSDPHTTWHSLPRSSVITIAHNTITNTGGDGIVGFSVSDFMVTDNVVAGGGARINGDCTNIPGTQHYCNGACVAIWSVISERATFQYNEVYDFQMNNPFVGITGQEPGDAQAFDADIGAKDSVFQYNYSHNNRRGFMLTYDEGGNPATCSDLSVCGLKVQYNVSYHDHNQIFQSVGPFNSGATSTTSIATINNNTFIISDQERIVSQGQTGNAKFSNNIFEYTGATPTGGAFDGGTDNCATSHIICFDSNIYHFASGTHPSDEPTESNKITLDPLLISPSSLGNGRSTLEGAKLGTGSPALASGSNPGVSTLDLWANLVPSSGSINRGAYNGAGLATTPAQNLAFRALITPSSSYEGSPWSINNLNDGQTSSVGSIFGYSSQVGLAANHTESLVIDLGAIRTFNKVTLYPRNDSGYVGAGFPIDFKIQVWNGSAWLTRVNQTGYALPGNAGQVFTWGMSDTTNLIKIEATNLRSVGGDYLLQFAELQVTN